MPREDGMTVDERRKYLYLVAPRYARAGRSERRALLTEMAAVTGLHRKSLLRLLHGSNLARAPQRPRWRRRRYGAAVADVVRVLWECLDYVRAERLTPVLLPAAHLATISRATVHRRLQRFQLDRPRLPRGKPQPPMERLSWVTPSWGHGTRLL